jgi:hypothetical protein
MSGLVGPTAGGWDKQENGPKDMSIGVISFLTIVKQ